MQSKTVFPQSALADVVIALHCSGASGKQWRALRESLGDEWEVLAPDHYGCASAGPWHGQHAFTLADEAAQCVSLMEAAGGTRMVHLVGHSYGGGVALRAALTRPDRVASLTLYEPSAFHLLREIGGPDGYAALSEIIAVARRTGERVLTGDYRDAAEGFVDYWAGTGAWRSLNSRHQEVLIGWIVKAPLDFAALLNEPTTCEAYLKLEVPVLILLGEFAPKPTRIVAEILSKWLPDARVQVIAGAGHMGPLTHADAVNVKIAKHLGMSRLRTGLATRSVACGDHQRAGVALRARDQGPSARRPYERSPSGGAEGTLT